jgi:HAD superfamily hydrolase (TIGR01509 family)
MIAAAIFDLDGTVIDNENLWETAFKAVFNNYHLTFNNEFKQLNDWIHEPGLGLVSNWKRIAPAEQVEELVRKTVQEYRSLSLSVSLRDGVGEAVEVAKTRGWQTGLCTGSTWSIVEKELEEMTMQLAFDVTVTGEEVLVSKPDPEIYFLAAQKLGIEPEEGLVVEDAIAGIRAAKEAGMKVIGLVSDYAPKELMLAAGADFTVDNFSDVVELFKVIE